MTPENAKRPYQEIVGHMLEQMANTGVITDLAPGGVGRTVIEAMSREFSVLYARMNAVYEAGFIDTATGASLDQLVALLGVKRVDGEAAITELRLLRDSRMTMRVIIPAGTNFAIERQQAADKVIFTAADDYEMREGESSLTITIRRVANVAAGETPKDIEINADDVALNACTFVNPIAGIAALEITAPSITLGTREIDEQLRVRAKMAISAAGGGTEKALTEALMAVPNVKAVKLRDATVLDGSGVPVVAPGELEVVLDIEPAQMALQLADINRAIDTHKGPGILVRTRTTVTRILKGKIIVRPSSASLTGAQQLKLVSDCNQVISKAVALMPVGGTLVWNRVLAGLMAIENLQDIVIDESYLTALGGKRSLGPEARLTDISVETFERLALGESVDAVNVVLENMPRLSVSLRLALDMAKPSSDVQINLQAELTELLSSYLTELNEMPATASKSLDVESFSGRISAPNTITSLIAKPGLFSRIALCVLDIDEGSEIELQSSGIQSVDMQTKSLASLASIPVILTWKDPII